MIRGCIGGLLALALLLASLQQARSAEAVTYHELLVGVRINGELVSDATTILEGSDGRHYIRADDVADLRLRPEALPGILRYRGTDYYAAELLRRVQVSFDRSKLELSLAIPLNALRVTEIATHAPNELKPTRVGGAFLNYDLRNGLGDFELGASTPKGFAQNTFAWQADASGPRWVRLDTSFEHPDVSHRTLTRFGDVTSFAGSFGANRHLAGVQWGNDYDLDPHFIRSAVPSFSDSSAKAQSIDVLLNGALLAQQDLPPGPFVLNDAPLANGRGQLEIKLTDAQGNRRVLDIPYFASPKLLRPHLSEFHADAGILRKSYGTLSNGYKNGFAQISELYGISRNATAEFHIEDSVGRLLLGYGLNAKLLKFGIASIGNRLNCLDGPCQRSVTAGYDYTGKAFSFGGRVSNFSESGPVLTESPIDRLVRQGEAYVSVSPARGSSLNLLYDAEAHSVLGKQYAWNATMNADVLHGYLTLFARRASGQPGLVGSLSFSLRLGRSTNVVFERNVSEGGTQSALRVSKTLASSSQGFGYDLEVRPNSSIGSRASVEARGLTGHIIVDYGKGIGKGGLDPEISGAVAFADHRLFLSRQITEGFGVAELLGYPGVRVYANNLYVGKTDRNGRVFLPELYPYQQNTISIDGNDLPVSANIQNANQIAVPYGRAAQFVRFQATAAGGVILHLTYADGGPLPAGATVQTADGKTNWPVANGGQAYVSGIIAGAKLSLVGIAAERKCKFEVLVPRNVAEVPDLGVVVCR